MSMHGPPPSPAVWFAGPRTNNLLMYKKSPTDIVALRGRFRDLSATTWRCSPGHMAFQLSHSMTSNLLFLLGAVRVRQSISLSS